MPRTPTRGPGRPPLPDDVRVDRARARSRATSARQYARTVRRTVYLDAEQAERVDRLVAEGGHDGPSALVEAAITKV